MASNYWKTMYGSRSQDFIDGVKAGAEAFAVWRDGEQFVGTMGEPLASVLREIDAGLGLGEKEDSNDLPNI